MLGLEDACFVTRLTELRGEAAMTPTDESQHRRRRIGDPAGSGANRSSPSVSFGVRDSGLTDVPGRFPNIHASVVVSDTAKRSWPRHDRQARPLQTGGPEWAQVAHAHLARPAIFLLKRSLS
jgi:hypothetical protein